MRFYKVEEFRKHLTEILDRVHFTGEPVTVMKRKKQLVIINPIPESIASDPVIGTPAPPLPTPALTKKVKP